MQFTDTLYAETSVVDSENRFEFDKMWLHKNNNGVYGADVQQFENKETLMQYLRFSETLGFKKQNSENIDGLLYDMKPINQEDGTLPQWEVHWMFINPDDTN